MTYISRLARRDLLKSTAVAVLFSGGISALPIRVQAEEAKKSHLKLALKYSMIGGDAPIDEKIALIKRIGYDGVEIDSPSNLNLDDLNAACKKHGIAVHGTIDSIHWDKTLSHPDETVRAQGLKGLLTAIEDCHKVGGTTALLVPGVVNKDVTYEQCYERSQAEIKKAIPLADKLGVKIAIEVVWNNFITKPEQLVQYVDDFGTDTVGAYFDCSNMLKYGVPAAEWIRKLDKRMLKFDFKGYNADTQKWVEIGQGTEDWPEVLKALDEIGYTGWATSEVGGGDEAHLTKVYQQMQKVLTK
ncbi:MAG: sugar phosphate isomerase/epimerase family protein [Pirellulales bacterium]|nr:sugar phosphate isomerase/epimerase family protein [Pirellulales bacterium]